MSDGCERAITRCEGGPRCGRPVAYRLEKWVPLCASCGREAVVATRMGETPRTVSVIIADHNGAKFLTTSVASALIQPEVAEVVIVDDGSDDQHVADLLRSVEALGSSRLPLVRSLRQEHLGQAIAIAHGVAKTTFPHVALLDVDDVWLPGKLARQLAQLDRATTLGGVVCRTQEWRLGHESKAEDRAVGEPRIARLYSALVMWRDAFLTVGMPRPDLGMGSLLEWFARAEDFGVQIGVVPEVLYHRGLHHENHGILHKDRMGEYHKALKVIMERRRAAAR